MAGIPPKRPAQHSQPATGNTTTDRQLLEMQRQVTVLTQIVNALPWAAGAATIENVTLSAGQTLAVAHKLGRKYRGWIPLSFRGAADAVLRQVAQPPQLDLAQITLHSVNACVVDLLVW